MIKFSEPTVVAFDFDSLITNLPFYMAVSTTFCIAMGL